MAKGLEVFAVFVRAIQKEKISGFADVVRSSNIVCGLSAGRM
jgi:hypothetical protein